MTYALYILGFVVLIAGLALGAQALGVSRQWIIVGIVIMAGIAILSIASSVERRPPHGSGD